MGSKKFSVNTLDLLNVVKNGGLVALAAFITYLMNNLHVIDLGQYTPLLIPVITLVLDTIVKWAKDGSKQEETKETVEKSNGE